MGNITLSMPENVHTDMKHFSEVKWSEVARKAIIDRLKMLHIAENLAKKSKLSKKDVSNFHKKIKRLATKKFMDKEK